MKKIYITIISLAVYTLTAFAQTEVNHNIDLKLGYSIGGTMPHGMPESIRALNEYSLRPNIQIGADYERLINPSWGISAGLHFENKGMKTDAEVKNYHMKMVQGEDVIEGMFSGNVVTETDMWQIAIPVQATYHPCSNLRLKAGPYLAIALCKKFGGYAYDGHLRKGDPTGPYVELGNTESERGDYNFDNELRTVNWGLSIGADYLISDNFGVYADFTWGLNGAFHSSFKTIEQTMYPVFGTIGVSYRLF